MKEIDLMPCTNIIAYLGILIFREKSEKKPTILTVGFLGVLFFTAFLLNQLIHDFNHFFM